MSDGLIVGHVGILEQFYHSHIAYQVAAAAEAAGHDVTLYVAPQVRERIEQFSPLEAGVVERGAAEPLDAYLSRVQASTPDVDILLVNTVAHTQAHDHPAEPYRSFLEFSPTCPIVHSIYGVNTWLADQPVTGAEATRNAFRRKLAARADALIAQYSPWVAYADAHFDSVTPVLEYPYPIYKDGEAAHVSNTDPVEVVLPGVLHRRDFETVLNAFGRAWDEQGLDVRLTVLARPKEQYDRDGVRILEKAQAAGEPVNLRTGFLPRDEYDAALRDADAIIAPLRETVRQRGFQELMGHTTNSGVIFDAIRVGRPLILPEFFPLGWELEDHGVLTYDGVDGLLRALTRLVEEDGLRVALEREARENASAFVLERQAERFDALLRKLERVNPVMDHR